MTSSINHPSHASGDSEILRINASSRLVRVVGFCFMLAGILLLALSLVVLMLGRAGPVAFMGLAAFGLLFNLAGWASSEKTVILVDKLAGSLTITSKCPGWQVNETYPLSDFQGILIVRYWNQSRHGARKLYRIVFERSADNADWVCVVDPAGNALAARSIASRLARFANLPLRVVDRTSPNAM